jgi:hypothetical protein
MDNVQKHNLCTLGRRLTTDSRSDWQVVSRSGSMSAIYLLTVFFNRSNLFTIFIHININFSISWMGPCRSFVKILDFIGVLSSTSWLIINLFIYLFIFCGRKSTTKCVNVPPSQSFKSYRHICFRSWVPDVWNPRIRLVESILRTTMKALSG